MPILVEGMGIIRQNGIEPVGAIYNDGGNNLFWDAITLTGDTWFGSRGDLGGNLTLRGHISDGGAGFTFVKVGPGLITLQVRWNPGDPWGALNSWKQTIIKGGVLRRARNEALPNANILFDGGILELASGPGGLNFQRNLGTGINEIQWQGDGGFSNFSNFDAARAVQLNGGATLTWGQQYFVGDGYTLLLGSRYGDMPVEFWNPIDLGTSPTGSHREIRGESSLAKVTGKISGSHAGTGLLKTGSGILMLEGGTDDYHGPTIIRDGALVANSPAGHPSPNTNLQLDGGVWIPVLPYIGYTLGTGPGQLQWLSSGGFAGLFGPVTVQLNGTTDAIAWGAQYFVGDGQELRFGHYSSGSTILWDKGLDLGTGTVDRTIRLTTGGIRPNAPPTLTFRQALLGGNQKSLFLVGNGKARVIAPNPDFHSDIKLYGTTLDLREQGSFTASAIDFNIRHGGTLSLYSDATHYSTSRIHDSSNVTLQGGSIWHQIENYIIT